MRGRRHTHNDILSSTHYAQAVHNHNHACIHMHNNNFTHIHTQPLHRHTQTHPGARSLPPPSQAAVRGFENISSAQRAQRALVFLNENKRNVPVLLVACCYLYVGSGTFKHKHQERMNTTNKNTRACSCVLFAQQKRTRISPISVFFDSTRQLSNTQTHKE